MCRLIALITLLAAILVAPAAGLAQGLPKQLEGKWKVNLEKSKEVLSDAVGDDQAEQLLSLLADFVVEFKAEGKAEIVFSGMARGATWEVVEQDEEEKTLKIKVVPDEGAGNDDVTTVQFLDMNTFKMSSEREEEVMVFSRVKDDDDGGDDDDGDDGDGDDGDG